MKPLYEDSFTLISYKGGFLSVAISYISQWSCDVARHIPRTFQARLHIRTTIIRVSCRKRLTIPFFHITIIGTQYIKLTTFLTFMLL